MARRLLRQPAVVALLLLFTVLALYQMHTANVRIPISKGLDINRLPSEYSKANTQSQSCEDRFGSDYLHAFQNKSASYCEEDSTSSLICFNNNVDPNHARTDSFCIGGPAQFIPGQKLFSLQCKPCHQSEPPDNNFIPLIQFPTYWYDTGPRYIFDHYTQLSSEPDKNPPTPDPKATTAVLIKREDVQNNMWHGLMEIMSTYLTLDILRMTINPITGSHYFSSSDFDNTQIIILDDLEDGPYFDLWHLFARKPVIRLTNLTNTETSTTYKNIITPLPGGSNPFWQGDWHPLSCSNSTLLRTFSSRVLYAYNIATSTTRLLATTPKSTPDPIQLTFINRLSKRKLLQAEKLLSLVRLSFPTTILTIHMIDYAALPFATQLSITHDNTDILVGVHGAGLTHSMFLKPGSAVVEIMPFNNLNHVGFQNLAGLMEDVAYYRGQSVERVDLTKGKGNWQDDDVWMEDKVFLELVKGVVEDMARRRGLI